MVTRIMVVIMYANVKLLGSIPETNVILYVNYISFFFFLFVNYISFKKSVCILVVANVHQLINTPHQEKIMIIHCFLFNLKVPVLDCDYCLEDK